MEEIEKHLKNQNPHKAIEDAISQGRKYLANYLRRAFKIQNGTTEDTKKVKLLCNWTDSKSLANDLKKMCKRPYEWDNIRLVWDDEPDYWVIINRPPEGEKYDPKRTVIFQMEPKMDQNSAWGEWGSPDPSKFLRIFSHKTDYNNLEWHISKTHTELMTEPIIKNPDYDKVLSTVLSGKYNDVGHIKRIDFVKFLEGATNLLVHVYGENRWKYKHYKGSLPYHCKDDGLLPYKYTMNMENNDIPNYVTEKLVDGILSECLTFYWGCPNVRAYIDERAYVQLTGNPQTDFALIKKAMDEDWHSKHLPYIRAAKMKILNELQFFPRISKLFKNSSQTEKCQ